MEQSELLRYLKDVSELEHQIYTYGKLAEKYRKEIATTNTNYGQYASLNVWFEEQYGAVTAYANIGGKQISNRQWYKSKECQDHLNKEMKKFYRKRKMSYLSLGIIMLIPLILHIKGWSDDNIFLIVGSVILGFFILLANLGKIERYSYNDEKKFRYDILNGYFYGKFSEIYESQYKVRISQKEKYEEELKTIIVPHIQNTKGLLKKLYSKDIIYPKYRNFIAMTQICEYIESGRCYTLEGPDGAYNLFESELRQNIIVANLKDINNQLDELNNTMHSICASLSYTNSLINNISNMMSYNSQCVAYNTNITNYYNY